MKQKLTALLLVLCMVMAFVPAMAVASAAENTGSTEANGSSSDEWNVWDGTVAEAFSDDSAGTESDPILIKSAAEFIYLRSVLTNDDTAGKYYQLAVNLDMNGKEVSLPYDAKKVATAVPGFAGVFDGAGNTIKNISDTVSGKTGLFYIVTSTGVVKNLTVTDSNFDVGWTNMTGTICYQLAGGTIQNCHVKSTTLAGGRVGGIASDVTSGSTIRGCSVNANFAIKTGGGSAAEIGGIAGSLTGAKITDCVVDGQFKDGSNSNGYGGRFGGIVGLVVHNAASVINNCVNNATINLSYSAATKTYGAGGIVGYVGDWGKSMLTVSNCTNNGAVTVGYSAPVGGIIGGIKNPSPGSSSMIVLENCNNTAPIRAVGTGINGGVGGMIGLISSPQSNGKGSVSITRCRNSGTITASGDNVGGMIGFCYAQYTGITLTECLNTGDVTGANNAGGLIGITQPSQNSSVIVYACHVQANVKATGNYAGLAVGYYKTYDTRASLTVQNSLLQGQVTAAGNAAAIIGAVGTDKAVPTPTVKLMNTYVQATVTVDAGGKAGTIAGGATEEAITGVTLTINGSKFAIQVVIGGSAVEAPNAYYNYAGEGTAVALDALDTAELTNGAAVSTLNNGLETVAWIQGTEMPELIAFYVAPEVPEITIDGASLTIGRNVTLNLFVKTETIRNAGVTVKTISIVNNDGDTIAVGELKGTNYVFTIEGLSAKEFGTNKIYKVQYTTEETAGSPITCTETITYSPLQYAINMYGKTNKAGLDEMLISLVNYADAAAKNTNASTAFKEKHTDADMTRVTAMETIVAKDTGKYTYDAKTMPGISATLTNAIELKVVPNEIYTDVTVKVGDEIIEKNGNGAYAFYATDLYNEITFTFTGAEGTEPLTATTSLVQFLNAYADTDYEALATATAQYLYAARYFCLKNQPNA